MDTQKCTGEPLINKKAMGGHVEDYCSPAGSKWEYGELKWVPVSESFKKSK